MPRNTNRWFALGRRPMQRVLTRLQIGLIAIAYVAYCAIPVGAQETVTAPVTATAPPAPGGDNQELLSRWEYVMDISSVPPSDGTWTDFILTPDVFDQANQDLSDLRLYAASGEELPFALRVRNRQSEKKPIAARQFNPTQGPDGSSEISFELQDKSMEHNELEVTLPAKDYRRRVELEGSDDGTTWRPIHSQYLIDFSRGSQTMRDSSLKYPPSRYQFLRLRVFPDPLIDKGPVKIGPVVVLRRVEIPGEDLTLAAELGTRQAVPADGGPGSAWIVNLGGDQTPGSRLEIEVPDPEFVRNFRIEAGGLEGSGERMRNVTTGLWRRRRGEPKQALVATFPEVRAARLRVVITDNRNTPLQLQSVKYSAAARQIVFASQDDAARAQLYFGNPDAESPIYDFARNLPEKLAPVPVRATIGPRTVNPHFSPKPLPLTERWPWLIYVVLSFASIVLLAIAISLSRAAIARHDLAEAELAAGE